MAVTLEFGKCSACGENNSKTLLECRACGAILPWAKPKVAPAAAKPRIGLGDIDWGPMAVQLSGGLIFVVGALLFVADLLDWVSVLPHVEKIVMAVGGAVWGYGQNME